MEQAVLIAALHTGYLAYSVVFFGFFYLAAAWWESNYPLALIISASSFFARNSFTFTLLMGSPSSRAISA